MAKPDPFESTIFSGDPRTPPDDTVEIYPAEQARLTEAVARAADAEPGAPGRLLMIRSREAGAGKSHLLAATLSMAAQHTRVLPAVFNRETPPAWVELFKQSLILLAERPTPSSPSPLSETARQLFAELVGDLISAGIVPSENPGRARRGLEQNYAELLDLRGSSPIANWFVENSDSLIDPLAAGLQRRTRMGLGACRDWLQFLIEFESGHGDVPVPENFASGEGQAKAHMRHLGQLVSRYRPLLLVFDHLDAFYHNRESALAAGCLFSELGRIGVAPLTLIAANDDLWLDTFTSALPSALTDRLTEGSVTLPGIGIDAAKSLVNARLALAGVRNDDARRFRQVLDLDRYFEARAGAPASPRAVLRLASETWHHGAPESDTDAPISLIDDGDHPGAAPARETLGRVQAMLRQFNRRKPAPAASTESPAPDSGDSKPEPSPWPAPPANAPNAVRQFATERETIYFGADLVFDPVAIRHTLELAGRRSPLIDYHEFHVAGGTDAASWRSPDHEILFGFEPAERIPYWRALVEQAGESPLGNAKVVAFTPPGTPAFETEGLNGHADERLDVLELDRCALATIAAADRVVSASDDEEATFALLAPELDSLWRRITRPMGV